MVAIQNKGGGGGEKGGGKAAERDRGYGATTAAGTKLNNGNVVVDTL